MNSSKKVVRKSFILLLLAFIVLMTAIFFTVDSQWFNRNVSVSDPNGGEITRIGFEHPAAKRSFSLFYSSIKDGLTRSVNISDKGSLTDVRYYQEVTVVPLDVFAVGLVLGWWGLRFGKAEKQIEVSGVGGKS